ncbi:hypothetical protein JCM10213_004902 [Rhodosporidiobolus nylandii]
MVYYVCPNCGHRSDEYGASMVHYNACDVVRVRNTSSTGGSGISANQPGSSSAAGGQSASPTEEVRQGRMGVAIVPPVESPKKAEDKVGEEKQ